MEWQILIVGGGTLLAFMGLIFKPLLTLNKTLTTLDISVNMLRQDLTDFKEGNKKSHGEIFQKLNDHEHRIEKNELQIEKLESTH
jgi:hypothetical protein